MTPDGYLSFAAAADLDDWLSRRHADTGQLWVRLFKRGTGKASVTWDDCVVAALTWGWIDGQRRALDESSYLQRITPRRPGSAWSSRNRALAERLTAEGRMQPAGLAQVEAARRNGRWDTAYEGSASMEIPEDFLAAVAAAPGGQAAYDALNRSALFTIYRQLQTASSKTRSKQMAALLLKLTTGAPIR